MTAAVVVLGVAVAVLTLLVAGLLRSHADILRRLHALDGGVDDAAGDEPAAGPSPAAASDGGDDRAAADLVGRGPDDDALAVRVTGVSHDTVLVFLSSGCLTCGSFWEDLAAPDLPAGVRPVIVTKGPDAESPTAIAELAPAGVELVMSTDAWDDYAVPGTPYVIHVDGPSGSVRGEGTGQDWPQVRRMLTLAAGDAGGTAGGASAKAAADTRRERDTDRALLEAGIRPGDPSLYQRADGHSTGSDDT